MAADKASLNGYFKEVYETLERATPNWAILQDKVPFQAQKRLGDTYNFPVKLRHSHGVTYAGGTNVGTAFTLNDPVSLVMRNASVSGTTIINQEDIPYDVLSMAQENGEAAFGDVMDEIVFAVREGAHFHTELMLLYGGSNIGVINGAPSGSGTTRTLTIADADWSPGIWAGMEGASVDVYDTTGATKRNSNADVVIGAVDFAIGTQTVVVTGNSTDMAALADTDIIVPKGTLGSGTEWSDGLHQLCTDTGTVHGIDSSSYALWKPNSYANGSAKLSMTGVQSAITAAMVRGLDEKVCCLTSPYSWSDINNDLSALRRYVNDTKTEMELGTKSIRFYGVTGAEVELMAHPMVKAGYTYTFPPSKMRRVGSSDVTNKIKQDEGDVPENFYQDLESKAAVRIRCYTNQALVSKQRARLTAITGITPTGF